MGHQHRWIVYDDDVDNNNDDIVLMKLWMAEWSRTETYATANVRKFSNVFYG